MKITAKEQSEFLCLIEEFTDNKLVLQMKNFIQHGNISTYEHCMKVAEISFSLNRKYKLKADEKVLVTSCLLHDFYLYDWHEKSDSHKLHGFTHPSVAAKNAEMYFGIKGKTKRCISTHMWPLTITKIPTSREGWILCAVDKYCALTEVFNKKGGDCDVYQ